MHVAERDIHDQSLPTRWLQGWTFQVVLMEGHVQVEAHGFGIRLRTAVLPGEVLRALLIDLFSPRIVVAGLFITAWLRGQELNQPTDLPTTSPQASSNETLISLVVVEQDSSKVAA